MCYQKVNQNWRKNKLLPSLGESRFSQPHPVTWTPRPPANSSPHSTSSPPPPTGPGAARCISLNLKIRPWARIKHHNMSFLVHKSESLWHEELFFKVYHSVKSSETMVLALRHTPGLILSVSSLPNWLFKPSEFLPQNGDLSEECRFQDGETLLSSWVGFLTHW